MAKDNNIIVLTGVQDSIPQSSSGTGTLTSVNDKRQISGSGTSFTTELTEGEWIYIKAQNAFRKVENIVSDTSLTIDEPFTVDLSGSAFDITPRSRYKEVSLFVSGAGAADIDGASFTNNEGVTYSRANKSGYGKKEIDPVDVNAAGTTVRVTTLL